MTSSRPASGRLARFARAALLAPLALVAVAAAGCMQSDTKVTVLADGSGTCSDTTTVDIAKTKELLEMAKAFGAAGGGGGGGGGAGGLSIPQGFDPEKALKARYSVEALNAQLAAVPGVEPKAVSSETKDGKLVAKREFAFADLSSLGQVVFETATAELKKNDDGSFTLDMDAIGLLRGMLGAAGGQQGAGPGAAGGFSGPDLMVFVGQMIPDLKVTRAFTLPGTILETNGKKSEDGKTVTWTFAAADLSTAGTDVSKAPGKMSVRFKGEGLTLKPFSYSPDLSEVMKAMQPKPAAPATPAAPKKPDEPKPADPTKPPEPTTAGK